MLDYHEMMIIVNQIVFKDKWTLVIVNIELDCELKEFYVDNG